MFSQISDPQQAARFLHCVYPAWSHETKCIFLGAVLRSATDSSAERVCPLCPQEEFTSHALKTASWAPHAELGGSRGNPGPGGLRCISGLQPVCPQEPAWRGSRAGLTTVGSAWHSSLPSNANILCHTVFGVPLTLRLK